jgi:hypothetical protein
MKSVPRPQKLQKEWKEEYAAGLLDMRYLWDRGFRPK